MSLDLVTLALAKKYTDDADARTDEQIAQAVADYLEENPIEAPKPDLTGVVKSVNGKTPDENGNVEITIPDSSQNPPKDGEDGFSPIAIVTQTADGATISITDVNGTTTAAVTNGKDGKDGVDGQDGYTPQKGVDYFDGQPGKDGADGKDGYTPVKGKDYFDGEDGQSGSPGKDGNGIKSAALNADYTLTLTFDDGTTYTTPSIRGATGATGSAGKDGTSVTVKSVSESTADGGSNVVTFSDGKTLTVKNGKDGKTPALGTDYFTATDKSEMVNAVIAALPVYAGEVV